MVSAPQTDLPVLNRSGRAKGERIQSVAHDTFRLRPLGVGDLLDETVRLYRRHFALFVGIAACVFIPAGLVGFVQQLALLGGQNPAMVGLFSLLPAPILGLANLAMSLAMIYAVSESSGSSPSSGPYWASLRPAT